jgi:hypothetical protein
MSLLVDPLLLFADGEAYARLAPESAQGGAAKLIGGATVAAILAPAVGSYVDARWTKPLWKPFGVRSGRDFMLNWPLRTGFDHKRTGNGTHAVAAAVMAAYPLFWWLGWDHGRRRRARPSS